MNPVVEVPFVFGCLFSTGILEVPGTILHQAYTVSGLELGMLSQVLRPRSKQRANNPIDKDTASSLATGTGQNSSPKRTLNKYRYCGDTERFDQFSTCSMTFNFI